MIQGMNKSILIFVMVTMVLTVVNCQVVHGQIRPHHRPAFRPKPPIHPPLINQTEKSSCRPDRQNCVDQKDLPVLSDEVQKELDTLHYRTRKTEITLRAKIDNAELDLERELNGPDPDLDMIGKIVDRLNEARGELFQLHVLTRVKAHKIVKSEPGS